MPFDIDDDEYVAKLLAQDAKKTSQTYDLVGIDAFSSKRPGAPKPNTNFLRHIIRQTDSHNAALLAKEAEESSSRLRRMNREREKARTEAVDRAKRNIEGRLSPPPRHKDSLKRHSRRRADNDGERNRGRGSERDRRQDFSRSRSAEHRDRSRERSSRKRRYEDNDEDRTLHSSSRSKHHHESSHRRHRGREEKSGGGSHRRSRRTQRAYSHSLSRSRSRSPKHKTYRKHDRSRSPRPPRHDRVSQKSRRRSMTSGSDSDPLEALVGPLPPPPEPTVRSRGRGALKANSLGIENRFSASYDPSVDVRPGSDAEEDWDEAVEAMRDRQRWKQQGADRLRAAGFKDEQVKRWEKGGDPLEDEVVWTKTGQDREWDRGKIVDDDGDIALKPEWGRLK